MVAEGNHSILVDLLILLVADATGVRDCSLDWEAPYKPDRDDLGEREPLGKIALVEALIGVIGVV